MEDANRQNAWRLISEEAQYLAILKRATAVKEVSEVSSKLVDVRGRADELEADLRFLRQ